jgi:hypothetical protein
MTLSVRIRELTTVHSLLVVVGMVLWWSHPLSTHHVRSWALTTVHSLLVVVATSPWREHPLVALTVQSRMLAVATVHCLLRVVVPSHVPHPAVEWNKAVKTTTTMTTWLVMLVVGVMLK